MKKIIAGRFVALDGPHHGRIRAVGDGIANARFLAFELEPELATGTGKVAGLGVMREPV